MDNSYKSEFEFLDFSNLDANGRDELNAILKPNVVSEGLKLPWEKGENDYNELSEQIQDQEEPKMWPQYEMEGNIIKFEPQTNVPSSVLVSLPSTIQYGQQLMAPMYPEWPTNMYISDPTVHPCFPGMAYSPNMFTTNNENQDINSMREGGRRGRGRGSKSYNRNMNHATEIQTSYVPDHSPYSLVPFQQFLCVSDPSVTSQQHPAAGQPIYFPSPGVYHSMAQQAHPVDYITYHQSPTNNKYSRQSQNILPQSNGESMKSTNHKPYEKRVQNVNMTKPSIHQTLDDDNNSSQTNIVTTVIVNNSNIDSSTIDLDENITAINNSHNKKFGFKIEHIVSTINENYKGIEKNDIPCVNIKRSIEVKQNGNDNKEYDETNSHMRASSSSMTSEATGRISEEFQSKAGKETAVIENVSEVNEAPMSTSIAANTSNKSWASLLKQNSESHTASNNKPTALIAPHNISISNNQIESPSNEKTQLTPKNNQDKIFSTIEDIQQKNELSGNGMEQPKPLHSEITQVHCDDPITYRMGEFLLGYQMDKQTVSLLPRGLTNRSNYCYINSILQALLACPPFYNLLMAMPYSKNPSKHSRSPLIDNMIKFAREFTPLSEGARLARKDRAQKQNEDAVVDIQTGVPFEPSYMYTILKNSSSPGVFSVEGRQEDAEEFLSCLLNGISDEMLELMKLANNNDQKVVECVETNVNYGQGEEEWKVMGPKNKGSITRSTDFGRTPLSDIFRGQLRSRVSRVTEQATDYVQPFFTLQLDIEKAESVKTALEILVGKDQLEGMTSSETKQQIEAWKQVTLEELPVILILHLKWFDYKPDGCSKIFKSVEFPVELKIEHKLMSTNAKSKLSSKQRHYKLLAVTYHDGKEATKGHYVTDAFHVGYGSWVRYDDSSLKGVSEINVLNPQPPRVPYLLYYRRCDTIGNNQSNVKVR